MEDWKEIDDIYVITRDGCVWNRELQRYLNICINNHGYQIVSLYGKSYSLHRLITEAFIPNPENKLCVDHINRNRVDNRIENLRWATHAENMFNKFKTGYIRITSSGNYEFRYRINRRRHSKTFKTLKEAKSLQLVYQALQKVFNIPV